MDHHTQFSFEIDNDNLGITPVENSFINLYMPQARGDYVKVYLYGLKQCFNHQAVPVDNIALSQLFNITEGDVKNAWTYWQDQKILSVTYSSSGQARVTYYNIPSIIMGGHHREETPDPVRAPKRLQPEDPAMEARMAGMFEKIQAMLGSRPLTKAATMTFVRWHQEYNFEPETIVVLVEYTINIISGKDNDFTSSQTLKYMESIARNWQEQGVVTFNDAETAIADSKAQQKRIYGIFRYLGLRRGPIAWEKTMIDNWFTGYGFDMTLITAAMDRTDKPNIRYIDAILKRWHDSGYTTLSQVEADKQSRPARKAETTPAQDADTKERKALMAEMDQKDIDFIWRLYDDNEPSQQ
ncbi:MAG: DnaD domain protein [Eubacteriaceae bacterium]|nr:DnaD domain protein [Eubacteriaceae bacterium]